VESGGDLRVVTVTPQSRDSTSFKPDSPAAWEVRAQTPKSALNMQLLILKREKVLPN
jgi:hypothetical protein